MSNSIPNTPTTTASPPSCAPVSGSDLFARIREIVTEGGKFPYDDNRVVEVAAWVFDSHRSMCTALQECVQKHELGDAGEKVDVIVLRAVERQRGALEEIEREASGALNNAFPDEAPDVLANVKGIASRALGQNIADQPTPGENQ